MCTYIHIHIERDVSSPDDVAEQSCDLSLEQRHQHATLHIYTAHTHTHNTAYTHTHIYMYIHIHIYTYI